MTTLATHQTNDAPHVENYHLKEKAVAAGTAVADLACETKHFVGDRLATLKTKTVEKAKNANTTVTTFVSHHPYKSLALAATAGLAAGVAAGLVVGLTANLLRRRH